MTGHAFSETINSTGLTCLECQIDPIIQIFQLWQKKKGLGRFYLILKNQKYQNRFFDLKYCFCGFHRLKDYWLSLQIHQIIYLHTNNYFVNLWPIHQKIEYQRSLICKIADLLPYFKMADQMDWKLVTQKDPSFAVI